MSEDAQKAMKQWGAQCDWKRPGVSDASQTTRHFHGKNPGTMRQQMSDDQQKQENHRGTLGGWARPGDGGNSKTVQQSEPPSSIAGGNRGAQTSQRRTRAAFCKQLTQECRPSGQCTPHLEPCNSRPQQDIVIPDARFRDRQLSSPEAGREGRAKVLALLLLTAHGSLHQKDAAQTLAMAQPHQHREQASWHITQERNGRPMAHRVHNHASLKERKHARSWLMPR